MFEGAIQGLTIEVRDLDRSRRFYEDLLGFQPGDFYEPTRWQPYEVGGQFFGIRENPGCDHRERLDVLNLVAPNVESLWQRVQGEATVVEPLEVTPWGSYKFVIADPDGYRIGVVQKSGT